MVFYSNCFAENCFENFPGFAVEIISMRKENSKAFNLRWLLCLLIFCGLITNYMLRVDKPFTIKLNSCFDGVIHRWIWASPLCKWSSRWKFWLDGNHIQLDHSRSQEDFKTFHSKRHILYTNRTRKQSVIKEEKLLLIDIFKCNLYSNLSQDDGKQQSICINETSDGGGGEVDLVSILNT